MRRKRVMLAHLICWHLGCGGNKGVGGCERGDNGAQLNGAARPHNKRKFGICTTLAKMMMVILAKFISSFFIPYSFTKTLFVASSSLPRTFPFPQTLPTLQFSFACCLCIFWICFHLTGILLPLLCPLNSLKQAGKGGFKTDSNFSLSPLLLLSFSLSEVCV